MRALLKTDIEKETGVSIISEFKRKHRMTCECECGRLFKADVYMLRKGLRCFFCMNREKTDKSLEEIMKFISDFELTYIPNDLDVTDWIKNQKKVKKRIIKINGKRAKFRAFEGVPLNILEQIVILGKTQSSYKIMKIIRRLNMYLISRTKIENILKQCNI